MKIKHLFILVLVFMVLITCAKKSKFIKEDNNFYIKELDVWGITNENEIGKNLSEINYKLNFIFGDAVQILEEKLINKANYCRVKSLKDKENAYWIKKDYIAKQFITITDKDTTVYTTPNENTKEKALLQPGDLGVVLGEDKEWLKTDFWAFRPKNNKNYNEFVGYMWIKKNSAFTSNMTQVKESYYLYNAYYFYYIENDKNLSKYFIEMAIKQSDPKKKKPLSTTQAVLDFKALLNK